MNAAQVRAFSVRSMTGYGAGEAQSDSGSVVVELRSVNHKHLDIRVRAPADLPELASGVEEVIRASCVRGRIEASLRVSRDAGAAASLDFAHVRRVYRELLQLRDELTPGEPLPLSTALALPGCVRPAAVRATPSDERAAREATHRACQALAEMRAAEGEVLARDLQDRLQTLTEHAAWIECQRQRLVEGQRARLRARVEGLLSGVETQLDPGRLAHEVAWLAEKSDVTEELTRIRSHVEQFVAELTSGRAAIGRKLDFLVQELGREVNTVGSKVADAEVAQRVVELKAELDRIREQLQNIL